MPTLVQSVNRTMTKERAKGMHRKTLSLFSEIENRGQYFLITDLFSEFHFSFFSLFSILSPQITLKLLKRRSLCSLTFMSSGIQGVRVNEPQRPDLSPHPRKSKFSYRIYHPWCFPSSGENQVYACSKNQWGS